MVPQPPQGHDRVLPGQWTSQVDSETQPDNAESSRLASIKEKAAIQYPITPHLDSTMVGSDGLLKDIVS